MDPKTPPPYPIFDFFDDIESSHCHAEFKKEEECFKTNKRKYQVLLCDTVSTRGLLEETTLDKWKRMNMVNNFLSHILSEAPDSSLSPERSVEDYKAFMKSEIKKDKKKCYEGKSKQRGKKKKGKKKGKKTR